MTFEPEINKRIEAVDVGLVLGPEQGLEPERRTLNAERRVVRQPVGVAPLRRPLISLSMAGPCDCTRGRRVIATEIQAAVKCAAIVASEDDVLRAHVSGEVHRGRDGRV